MSTFGDALNFMPPKKANKKLKAAKLSKHGKGKFGKLGKNGKPLKPKGRKPQPQDPDPGIVPGTSKAKKKEDAVDLEQQFILRMPPGPAMALRRDVESGAMNLKDKLGIELDQDMRHARVTYGGQVLNAKLVDLPTVTQCMKTTDMKTFYTVADISQMLVCVSDDEESKEDTSKKKDKDHKWKWNHGITPPLKNVRKRRFRKTMKKKSNDQPDIEKEVRRLFRTDCEAIDVKWEVVIEDPSSNNPEMAEKQVLAQGGTGNYELDDEEEEEDTKDMEPSMMDIGEEEIFGEVSSSEAEEEEEEEDGDLKDVNIMDSEEEIDEDSQAAGEAAAGTLVDFSSLQAANETSTMSDGGGDDNLNARQQELERRISELAVRRDELQQRLAATTPADPLHDTLTAQLQATIHDSKQLEDEYTLVSSMIR